MRKDTNKTQILDTKVHLVANIGIQISDSIGPSCPIFEKSIILNIVYHLRTSHSNEVLRI